MNKILITILLILITSNLLYAQRFCNSPNCAMCNRLFGPLPTSYVPRTTVGDEVINLEKGKRFYKMVEESGLAPIPKKHIIPLLETLNLTNDDILYDLGCGDGRILIEAVKNYGCKAVGIEINSAKAAEARGNVNKNNLSQSIRIVAGDIRKYSLDDATAVTMYLYPDLIDQIVPKIKTKRVASYMHKFRPTWQRYKEINGGIIYYDNRERTSWW